VLTLLVTDPDTYWLNVTNIGLGLVVLICLLVVILGVVHELVHRRKERIKLSRELDRDLKDLVAQYEADPRILHDAALGPTMADGGDQIDKDKK
jgi:hypothetical protein